MIDLTSIYIEEKQYSDTIFKNINANLSSSIEDNLDYSDVSSKIWYYTNIIDIKPWVDDDTFPVPVKYSPTMFNNEEQAIFIVKRYSIKRDSFYAINILLRYIENKEYNTPELHDTIERHSRTMYDNDDMVIRLVYKIPYDTIKNNEYVKTNNVIIYKDIKDMLTYSDVGLVDNKNHINYKVSYHSTKRDVFNIPLPNGDVVLKSNFSALHDFVNVSITDEKNNLLSSTKYSKDNFLNGDMIHSIKNNDEFSKLVDRYSSDHKEVRDWIKLFIDKDISLHKVESTSINNLIAESKLEKEDLALSRESLKTLKDLLF